LDVIFNLRFHLQGNLLAIGTKSGCVQVWDVVQSNLIKVMKGQSGRVDALAWNGDVLTSGSYNGLIMEHNVRTHSLVL
jgi:cell division cycle protein 20 (cofactor of APC complex)